MENIPPIILKLEKKLIEEDDVDPQAVNFGALTLESDNFLAVRQVKDSKQELLIFDLNDKSRSTKKFITAKSAIINPKKQIIALHQSNQLQVYDLENKVTLRSYVMIEPVEFWTWISATQLGVVTADSVYHWDIICEGSPTLYFTRDPAIFRHQVVDYKADLNVNWAFLAALNVDKERRITGSLQIYSKEKNMSQIVNSHSGTFAEIVLNPLYPKTTLLALSNRDGESSGRIKIVSVPDGSGSDEKYTKCSALIPFDSSKRDDFPIFTKFVSAYSLVFVITKYSTVHAYDLKTCTLLFSVPEFCTHPVFASALLSDGQGVIVATRYGRVYSIRVSGNHLIPYMLNDVKHRDIAIDLALRAHLPGVENQIIDLFNKYIGSGSYEKAAELAAVAPDGILRTQDTLDKLKTAPSHPSQTPPLLTYFKILLETSTLDCNESMELVTPAVKRGKNNVVQRWISSNKLTYSEALGDVIMKLDSQLAFDVYVKAKCHQKVVSYLISTSKFDEIQSYCDGVNYNPEYFSILKNAVNTGSVTAFSIAKFILEKNIPPKTEDLERVMDILLGTTDTEMGQKSISFLLGYLQQNNLEYEHLQTNLIAKSLELNPFAADAILASGVLMRYNKDKIAKLCEECGLKKRAILNYTSVDDIKRCLASEKNLDNLEVHKKIASLPQNLFFDCLESIIQSSHNEVDMFLVSTMGLHKEADPSTCVYFLKRFNRIETAFQYLNSIIPKQTLNSELTYMYIEIACKLSHFEEAASMCVSGKNVNCSQVKDFLKSAGGGCSIPLIHICDRFNLIDELIIYFYQRNDLEMIEYYIKKINPARTPEVVGCLIKLDSPKSFIEKIIALADNKFSLDEIIKVCESNDNLSIIHMYLESQTSVGNNSETLSTALAKIYIEKNLDPEKFLAENHNYNYKTVGDYCRNINPKLSLICYKKGNYVDDIISLTNENSMFKTQIEYLITLSDQKVWESVISQNNHFRDSVMDQIFNSNILSTCEQNDASTLVKAFMIVAKPSELLKLLEVLVRSPKFKSSRNLRNLLILTAIKTDRTLVRKCLDEVDNFDAVEIANTATSKGYYDEAYYIYVKAGLYDEAIDTNMKYIHDMNHATELAEKANSKRVWIKLAKGWLDLGNIEACIKTCVKSNEYSLYPEIIAKAKEGGNALEIMKFIKHARSYIHEQMLDTEYALSLAEANNIEELQELLATPNLINCNTAAEECFNKKLYKAAEIMFLKVPNYHRHSETLLRLNDLTGALESANKAKNSELWLAVASAGVNNGNFLIAEQAGLNIMTKAEKLENLILLYESCGRFDEVISFLETGISRGNLVTMNICSNLAVLYCKYQREKLFPHIKRYIHNINITKLIKACTQAKLWKEVIYLYIKGQEFDSAIQIVIRESGKYWNHQEFKLLAVNAKNYDVCEKAIKYYIEEHINLLEDLLHSIKNKIDLNKFVELFEKMGCLSVAYSFFESVKDANNYSLNTVYNNMLIQKQDYKNLRISIDRFTNFDQLEFARKLEMHCNFEMRRISAYLYSRNGRQSKSIEVSVRDCAYDDAVETILRDPSQKGAESLLITLAQDKKYCWFAFMLYRCHQIIDPSLVMELAWLNGLNEYAMPFYVQTLHTLTKKIASLEEALNSSKTNEHDKKTLFLKNTAKPPPLNLPPPRF